MTCVVTDLDRFTVGTCEVAEHHIPWEATGTPTFHVTCRCCDLDQCGLDRDTATDVAVRHICEESRVALGMRRQRHCSVCGAPCDGGWCSQACHKADEPGAYELGDGPGPFDGGER